MQEAGVGWAAGYAAETAAAVEVAAVAAAGSNFLSWQSLVCLRETGPKEWADVFAESSSLECGEDLELGEGFAFGEILEYRGILQRNLRHWAAELIA